MRQKILILDDDTDLLGMYRGLLEKLPSHPEIHIASSAPRAIALLESEAFAVLITDLRMPKIDGFQVLMSVRQKFPALRTVVLTALADEQYRARAYAMGIDLYAEKPTSPGEIKLFCQCVESLLGRVAQGGFRGVQSKSLMDLVQFECLSQNSSVLRITNGSLEGCIWFQNGEVVDATVKNLRGEDAFKTIFEWKAGTFEILPGEPERERTIFTSYESLLLDAAQAIDESKALEAATPHDALAMHTDTALLPLVRVNGVESLLVVDAARAGNFQSWGLENAERFAEWTRRTMHDFRELGARIEAGPLDSIDAASDAGHFGIIAKEGKELLAVLDRRMATKDARETFRYIASRWEP